MTALTSEGALVCVRPHGWITPDADDAFGQILAFARRAEQLGFDGLFLGDRMLAAATTESGTVYGASMLEVTTTLAALAAATERLLLGPLVLVAPYRHPIPLAKALATIDVISGGRLVLGAGTGWNRREFATLGIDPKGRGDQLEATLDVLRKLWAGETVDSTTRWWSFDDVALTPRPAGGRQVPVWLASFSPDSALDWADAPPPAARRVLDRVGRVADGWAPLVYSASSMRRLSADVLAAAWSHILQTAADHGRKRSDIDFVLSDWCCVVESTDDERRCREALATFFAGDWQDARRTYTIGTREEVAAGIAAQATGIDRVDGYVLTPLIDDPEQLDALAELPLRGRTTVNRPAVATTDA
jgi:probable F420-dependent oxidoreductase